MPGGTNYRPGGAQQSRYEADLRAKASQADLAALLTRVAAIESGMGKMQRTGGSSSGGSSSGSSTTITTTTSNPTIASGAAALAPTPVSIGLSLPTPVFKVSNSPANSGDVLTGEFVTQSPNTVWAGPATGTDKAVPTFRALVNADLPTSTVPAGIYNLVTVNSKGIVTAGVAGSNVPLGQRYVASVDGTTINPAASTAGRLEFVSDTATMTVNLPEPADAATPDGAVFWTFKDDGMTANANQVQVYCAGAGTIARMASGSYIPIINNQDSYLFIACKSQNNYFVFKL